MKPETTCCFTGHRPKKLPWGENETTDECLACKALLAQEVETAWRDGYRMFLCGMAMGADLYWAEAVLAARTVHPEVRLIAAIPCRSQTARWPEAQVRRYRRILSCLPEEDIVFVQQEYTRYVMQKRDEYMVNAASRVVALYDGSKGGTGYTVQYARRKKRQIIVIDPRTLERTTEVPRPKTNGQ